MKISYKEKLNTPDRAKIKRSSGTSFSPNAELSAFPNFKNNNNERPLNTNSMNLSFKGLFYSPLVDKATKATKVFDAEEFLKITKAHMGSRGENLFNSVKNSEFAKELISVNGNKVTFKKKTIFKLILDGLKYPFTVLPADMLNGTVEFLGKFKPFENWSKRVLATKIFKNIRQRSKIDAKINALKGLFETVDANKNLKDEELKSLLFKKQIKMFDPKTGNYDTKHERSLNRIVSGLIPAVFLANDAYNLSIMCDDNKKEANKEKKIRFKQETARVVTQAYITLITMGAIQKYINKSKVAVMLNVGLTALFTESMSRLIAGKQISRITPEQAKEINRKNAEAEANNDYKGVFFKSNNNPKPETIKTQAPVKIKNIEKPKSEASKDKKDNKGPLLSFENLFKAIGVAIAAGYAIKGLRTNSAIEGAIQKVSKGYDKIYKKITVKNNVQLEIKDFNKIIDKLKKGGFEDIAQRYEKIATDEKLYSADKKHINLGSQNRKVLKPIVDFIVGPVKFTWGVLKSPFYWTEKAIGAITRTLPKKPERVVTELDSFKQSINCIGKEALRKNFNPEKFKDYVEINSLKGFNEDNVSGIANSDLANLAKTAVFAATLPFLMSDNYNMVMLKSNGEDKENADLKYKERLVQESSRFFYSTLLISLFNNAFQSQYHNSLFGMSWVTAICTTVGEVLNRKSVGVPVGTYTRDEIVQMDQNRQNASPFVKGYYNFMAKLTGKKSLAEQRQIKDEKKAKA